MQEMTPDKIREKINIADYVASCGVELAPACGGKEYVGRCPFHDDERASFFVNPEKGLFHCFGCGAGGNLFSFIMRRQGVNFRQAVMIAMNRIGKLPPRTDSPLERLAAYYHFCFKRIPSGREYLASRGIRSEAVIEKFRIGFAPGGRRAAKALLDQGFDIGALKSAHLLNRHGRDAFFGRVTVPLCSRGRVVNIYGRSLSARYPHMYLPGPRGDLFNADSLRRGGPVIVCESVIDCLTLVEHGFENSIAAFSANVADGAARSVIEARPNAVFVAFDGDDAGRRGAEAVVSDLAAAGLRAHIVPLPEGSDVNSFFLDDPVGAKLYFEDALR